MTSHSLRQARPPKRQAIPTRLSRDLRLQPSPPDSIRSGTCRGSSARHPSSTLRGTCLDRNNLRTFSFGTPRKQHLPSSVRNADPLSAASQGEEFKWRGIAARRPRRFAPPLRGRPPHRCAAPPSGIPRNAVFLPSKQKWTAEARKPKTKPKSTLQAITYSTFARPNLSTFCSPANIQPMRETLSRMIPAERSTYRDRKDTQRMSAW